jgi:hypothetical protein
LLAAVTPVTTPVVIYLTPVGLDLSAVVVLNLPTILPAISSPVIIYLTPVGLDLSAVVVMNLPAIVVLDLPAVKRLLVLNRRVILLRRRVILLRRRVILLRRGVILLRRRVILSLRMRLNLSPRLRLHPVALDMSVVTVMPAAVLGLRCGG